VYGRRREEEYWGGDGSVAFLAFQEFDIPSNGVWVWCI
jgi:hypothetical protein